MHKKLLTLLLGGMLSATFANIYTFHLDPIYLEHNRAFTWGIDFDLPSTQVITGAYIDIPKINNSVYEADNELFFTLLDDAPVGVTQFNDNHAVVSNYFNGQGLVLESYSDLDGNYGYHTPMSHITRSIDIGTLTTFIANGNNFALGMDPDCYYITNPTGIDIVINTVPEPASMSMIGIGLVLLGGAAFRRKKKI